MKLIHRSARAKQAVRTASPGEHVFIGAVVMILLLTVLGDLLGPLALGEAGMELALFDMGGEGAMIAFQHWSVLEAILAAAAIAFGLSVIRNEIATMVRSLVSVIARGLGKVPI